MTSFGLSFAAVDILSEGLGVNPRVYPFEIPSFGEFVEDRVRIAGAVRTDLINRGLADNRDLAPDVRDALSLLSNFQVAVAVMGDVEDGRMIFARAAATAKRGVVIRQEDQILRFDLVRPESLARSVVALLPPLNPGPGQSVTISRPNSKPVQGDEFGLGQQVRSPRTTNTAQLRIAEDILRRKRLGSGHFTVTGRDRFGRVVRTPSLGWIDTDAGRYVVQSHVDENATTGTYFPADNNRIIHQLNELLKAVS
jgi:hypothetical protein